MRKLPEQMLRASEVDRACLEHEVFDGESRRDAGKLDESDELDFRHFDVPLKAVISVSD